MDVVAYSQSRRACRLPPRARSCDGTILLGSLFEHEINEAVQG
jgi:hypothetical protein